MTVFEGVYIGFLAGVLAALLFFLAAITRRIENVERDHKTEHGTDNDLRLYVPVRDRDRRGDSRYSEEEVTNVLYTLRAEGSRTEREILDQVIDDLDNSGEAHIRQRAAELGVKLYG